MVRLILLLVFAAPVLAVEDASLPVSREHPRLLGTRAELQALAKARPQEFQRTVAVAKNPSTDDLSRAISLGLVAAINNDAELARAAHAIAMKLVNGPIRKGHVTFGYDLALTALVYDLCHEVWSEADRTKFHKYFNKTVDANVDSETHVFHNAWYSYKNWGIGLAALASYHENPRSPEIFDTLARDYRTRAAPALELAGGGGGWAEGYYIHYWLYEWLFFCEAARRCADLDYYKLAPRFYKHRALSSAFETYPSLSEYNSRRPIPMGDGGGRTFGGDRDKQLAARRILVNYFREDPLHQALHTFNEQTPRVAVGNNAYQDFLWHDTSVAKGDLKSLPLFSQAVGPGYVYARSSWQDDATYFFFKAGDRFTAHQHLDNGHFLIYRGAELAGDGGHYEGFGSRHDANYHMRSIAHSTILVHDPSEKWPQIRGGKVTGNDGGQHHNWPHHNGAASDPQDWKRNRHLYDIADWAVFDHDDQNRYLYLAADLTRAYSSNKLQRFTRQIVYILPSTFVIFDQVVAAKPEFRKTWLLQAMKTPERTGDHLVLTNGPGKLFLQPLLPNSPEIHLAHSEKLYAYDNQNFPPANLTGPAPECRIEISPSAPNTADLFLNVLTAGDSQTPTPKTATVTRNGNEIRLQLAVAEIQFVEGDLGANIKIR